jgi:hypothetical protein
MSYLRDTSSGLVINTNEKDYQTILARRYDKKKIESVCQELNNLKSELSDIKEMLQQVIGGK